MTSEVLDPNQVIDNIISDNRYFLGDTHKIRFELFPNYVEAEVKGIKKAISISDFKGILDNQLNEAMSLNTIAMPPGCFLMGQSSTEIQLNCYYPEVIREVEFKEYGSSSIQKFLIPFPNTIIYNHLKKDNGFWDLKDTRYFCTPLRVTQLKSKGIIKSTNSSEGIFRMTFPNFYENDTMCFGQNTYTTKYSLDNLRGLEWLYQVIFSGAFNTDLGIRGLKKSVGPATWFESLSKLDKFPYEKLSGFESINSVNIS